MADTFWTNVAHAATALGDFVIVALNTAGGGALIGAGAALLSALMTSRAERDRFKRALKVDREKEVSTDLRDLLRDLMRMHLESTQWLLEHKDSDEVPQIPAEDLAEIGVKIGILRDEKTRQALENSLHVLENLNEIAPRIMHPGLLRETILQSAMAIGKSAARGDKPPLSDLETVEAFAAVTTSFLEESRVYWEQHGKG